VKSRRKRRIRGSIRRRVVSPWLLIGLAIVVSIVMASSPVAASADDVLLIVNAEDKAGLPGDYRSTSATSKLDGDHRLAAGVEKLRASGSGQFSEKGLTAVSSRTGGAPLVVLDLRQESHGFVGGTAVSWFGPRNAANQGKTAEQISEDEAGLLAGLANQPTITVGKITEKSSGGVIEGSKPVSLPAQTVQSEEQLVHAQGAGYVRVNAADYVPFTDEQVDQLVAFWQNRSPDSWVHVHCNAGGGRTTTALVLFDMLENATTVRFKDVVDRQDELGGNDVLAVRSKPKWRHDAQVARAQLVRRFYQYAREHPRGEGETWSSWAARNP
jgi:predicted protein tyrosine phosphatase